MLRALQVIVVVLLVVLIALLLSPARADVILEASPGDGTTIVLHDTPGPCHGQAKFAEYIAKDGSKIPGCYKTMGAAIAIVFLDTDTAVIPISELRQPKKL